MEKMKQYISPNNLAPKLPLFPSLTSWLSLDYFNAPEWVYGIVIFLNLVAWIIAIWKLATYKSVDIFKAKNIELDAKQDKVLINEKIDLETQFELFLKATKHQWEWITADNLISLEYLYEKYEGYCKAGNVSSFAIDYQVFKEFIIREYPSFYVQNGDYFNLKNLDKLKFDTLHIKKKSLTNQ